MAEVAALSKEEYAKYWESEKVFYDNVGAFLTADQKGYSRGVAEGEAIGIAKGEAIGIAKGEAKGRTDATKENARKMKADGMASELIAKYTGLTVEEIGSL